jgi:hypothetical protein
VYGKKTDSVYYLEYLDPVEAWIKLPGVISTIMSDGKRTVAAHWTDTYTTAASADNYLWVRYRDGVDRVFAQRMMSIFLTDITEATGRVVLDITGDMEDAIEDRQGVQRYGLNMYGRQGTAIPGRDWKAYIDTYIDGLRGGRKIGYVYSGMDDAMMALITDVGFARQESVRLMIIEVSKQGNKTRFQLLGDSLSYSLDFTDMRDFIRQVRGMSLSIHSKQLTAGYDLGIVQGVKYNYWKYAGEDSAIPDILTYTQPYPNKPDVRIDDRSYSTVTFMTTEPSATVLYYYSTENDFSKAAPIDPRKRFYYVVRDNTLNQWHTVYGLTPNTRYYIWATRSWGNLVWLQSEPVLFETSTRAEGRN